MEFSLHQKHFILWTKGHFDNYVEPEKVIVGEALMMYPEQVDQHNLLHYAIGVFDKLMRYDCIEGVNGEPFAWIINEMRQIGNRHKAPTLYEFLISHIGNSIVGGLSLEMDLNQIKSKMTKINN